MKCHALARKSSIQQPAIYPHRNCNRLPAKEIAIAKWTETYYSHGIITTNMSHPKHTELWVYYTELSVNNTHHKWRFCISLVGLIRVEIASGQSAYIDRVKGLILFKGLQGCWLIARDLPFLRRWLSSLIDNALRGKRFGDERLS